MYRQQCNINTTNLGLFISITTAVIILLVQTFGPKDFIVFLHCPCSTFSRPRMSWLSFDVCLLLSDVFLVFVSSHVSPCPVSKPASSTYFNFLWRLRTCSVLFSERNADTTGSHMHSIFLHKDDLRAVFVWTLVSQCAPVRILLYFPLSFLVLSLLHPCHAILHDWPCGRLIHFTA